MSMRRAFVLTAAALTSAAALATSGGTAAGVAGAATGPATGVGESPVSPAGAFALSGADARAYVLPDDVRRVGTTSLSGDGTATRYQQVVDGATVFGGQVTVIEAADGEARAVVGAHFPGLQPANSVTTSGPEARDIVQSRIGSRGEWDTALRLDPRTHTFFYEVDSVRSAHRPVRWVDAETGEIRKAFDAVAQGEGVGVMGDRKPVDSTPTADGAYLLRSRDGRQQTFDAGNETVNPPGAPLTDADDVWSATEHKFRSPDQRAAVDAHYYAGLVDDFYRDVFHRNSLDGAGMPVVSTVHFGKSYCNAFWNGVQMTYGDGDGKGCLPVAGALDVVAHELTHGVTDFGSDLVYYGESGALNESFSDVIGTAVEFYAAQHGTGPAASPDWRIGEDVVLDRNGFRNMADPQEYGDPDHYSERYTGPDDDGGVHINSGIPNQAFFLAVNGGRNAGCAGSASGHHHASDCDVTVPAIGLGAARDVFYTAMTSLPEYSNFCDARNATVAVAGEHHGALATAWAAVGVRGDCDPTPPPPPPCEGDAAATVPFESPHPYGNREHCTWTYDHGSGGFAFHFSRLETEPEWDLVRVLDGDGNVLATYDGTARRPVTTPCIPTPTGSVQLTSDESVTSYGFVVDAVEPCKPKA
jgi:bacillolysin